MEQEDNSEDDDPAELETLCEEYEVIPEEMAPEESDTESEAHVAEAFLAGGEPNRKRLVCGKDVDSRENRQCARNQKQLLFSWGRNSWPSRIHVRKTRN